MFPYYRGAAGADFSLGYDDILAMYELYGKTKLMLNWKNHNLSVSFPDKVQRPLDDSSIGYQDGDEDDSYSVTAATTTPTTTSTTTITTSKTLPTTTTTTSDGMSEDPVDYQDDQNTHPPDDEEVIEVGVKDICSSDFDTFVNIRGELFVFKKQVTCHENIGCNKAC
jgi:hypothetical protein